MKSFFLATICAVAIGTVALAPTAYAQTKTVKACQEEWRANKDANQKAGITEKDYVAKCRAGTDATATPPASTTAPAPTGTPKTAKACRDEWRANKEANQKAGITEKDYVAKCRAGTETSSPTPTPTPTPTATPTPAPAPAPTPAPTPTAKPAPTPAPAPTGAGQFSTEALAKAHCPADIVVWVNLKSKVYHFNGTKNYGDTKSGAYMCEKEAMTGGFRAAKNEKHP